MKQINPEDITRTRQAIGGRVREFRQKKKLTLKEVADLLSVSEGTASKIETGKWMSLDILIKLGVILDFDVCLAERSG